MTKYSGYCGKFLRVNLSKGIITEEELPGKVIEKYIGANGLGAYYLYKETEKGVDPLGENNKLILFTGPLTGTIFPSSPKIGIFSKSPLTGGFMDSYAGGHFGAELKFAGYDGMIVEGKSEKPVYIWINNGEVELRDAAEYWGKSTTETREAIKKEVNDDLIRIAVIGPAGEKMVHYACIMVDGTHAAGRGGLGAVMGSKKLKAIAIRGTKNSIKVADEEKTNEIVESIFEEVRTNKVMSETLPTFGTTTATLANNSTGILGTRNWQTEVFENAEDISHIALKEQLFEKTLSCFQCPVRCVHYCKIKEGEYKGLETMKPQYETVYSLGSLCGINDPKVIAKANYICNEAGIDTISAGVSIAFVMECFEKGILTEKELEGIEARFGNGKAVIALLEKVVAKEGIGEFISLGTKRMSEKLGKGTEKFAIHVKGLELAGHSIRGYKGMSLGYAVSNRGGSHQDMRHIPERSGQFDRRSIEGKEQLVVDITSTTVIRDTFTYCAMVEGVIGRVGLTEKHVNIINAVCGFDFDLEELKTIATRILNLERCFNIREGMDRKDDTIPGRFMTEPIPEGPSKGMYTPKEELDEMLDKFYKLRGWDENGIPLQETIKELGLDDIVKDKDLRS
ncbi:MAG: aldehyde:ferredoxin oxidoreductase [Thermosediminibacterales bacterium]|nr:aldehyde:ferredoxin oxidoreductase [Thermosediminibacterales bacterium]MDK2836269.1 aldehyde:ferredoxin oxidoreductase [Thermosediminibacterales bacterium]